MSVLNAISEEIGTKLGDLLTTIERSKAAVEAETAKALQMSEPYIGKSEAAEYLNISVTTLERRMALSDGPPRYVDGGKVSFLRSELRTWRRQWRAGDQTGLEEP
jgi:hypothetical protein